MSSEDERKKLLAQHLAKYTDKLVCPICGHREWNAMASVVTPVLPGSFLAPTNQAVPWGFLACRECGFAHFFAWKVVEEKARG